MLSVMEITTNIGCKNSCSYCPQDKLVSAYKKRSNIYMMGLENFKGYLDKIPSHVNIHFTGMSEPFLNPECVKMILYTHEKKYKIRISTTLIGMRIEDIDTLQKVRFEVFAIHLPSVDYESKIQVDESYLEILDKISKSSINTSYHIHGKSAPESITHIVKNIRTSPLITRAGNLEGRGKFLTLACPKTNPWGVPIKCTRELRRNVLLPNGEVLLCCMDYSMQHILGDLSASDYASLFRSTEFHHIKRGLTDPALNNICHSCSPHAHPA